MCGRKEDWPVGDFVPVGDFGTRSLFTASGLTRSLFTAFGLRASRGRKVGAARERGKGGYLGQGAEGSWAR